MSTTEERLTLTVADRRLYLQGWKDDIEREDRDFATIKWKTRATEHVERIEEALSAWPADMELLPLEVAIQDERIDPEMRLVLKWQYRQHLPLDDFELGLIQTAVDAGEENFERLCHEWPELRGIRRWQAEPGWSDLVRGLPIEHMP